MNENNLFFRVYELKDKFTYLIKQASKKVEKFNLFKIIRAKFDKKLRQPFRPVDILFAPVKEPDQLVNCFLSEKLNLVLRASCSDGPKSGKVKRSTAWQSYFCLNYYARKERYNTQSLLTFEENLKLKGDIPLVAYIDFENTILRTLTSNANPKMKILLIGNGSVVAFAHCPSRLTLLNLMMIRKQCLTLIFFIFKEHKFLRNIFSDQELATA